MKWFQRPRRRLSSGDEAAKLVRAKRFPIRTRVRFCLLRGDQRWREGVTENLSCTGLLVRAEDRLAPNTPIAVQFQAPPELTGGVAVGLQCEGHVVRTAPNGVNHGGASGVAMGVAIEECRVGSAQITLDPGSLAARAIPSGVRASVLREVSQELNQQLAIIVGNADLLLSHADPTLEATARTADIKRAGLAAASALRRLSAA
jgi:hypothetical protein